MDFLVQRKTSDGVATSGELLINGVHQCWTLEPAIPIPAGTYSLLIYWSPHFQRDMPHVDGVPGYTGIEIHFGNWAKDTRGCTLVGKTEGIDFVGYSDAEFDVLFQIIQNALLLGPQHIIYADPIVSSVNFV
jgi:hypothetical protein